MTNIAAVAGENLQAGDLVRVDLTPQGTKVYKLKPTDIKELKQEHDDA